jgi:peptide-methionine (S)-S-oxide reductase
MRWAGLTLSAIRNDAYMARGLRLWVGMNKRAAYFYAAAGVLAVVLMGCVVKSAVSGEGVGGGGVMTEKAMFGAGCFWGVESTFQEVSGVVTTAVGFAGGHVPDPSYKRVCQGDTGHAEVILVEFDPAKTTYEKLLDIFWENHDPTQVNRQGPDVGDQYRSVIFTFTPEQKRAAEASRQRLQEKLGARKKIATQIEDAGPFYQAEEYHQRYFSKRGIAPTCHTR